MTAGTRNHALRRLTTRFAGLLATVSLAASAAPALSQNLSAANVEQIIAAAAAEATARGVDATIAVVDRVGNVLGVFDMSAATPGAPPRRQLTVTTQKGIPLANGLEQVQQVFTANGATESPSTRLSAIAKAITGAYLSSSGNAFTTRTASQIVQEHFNPRERYSPSGPLFGVQFSQMPCSDMSVRFATNTGGFTGLVSATFGPKRSPLGLSADPGGLPLYINGAVVGGIGVEADNVYTVDPNIGDFDNPVDELIALAGQFSFQPPRDIRADRIFVEGKSLRYTDAQVSSLLTNPTAAVFVNGGVGSLVAVPGYYSGAAAIAGQAYGTVASGFSADVSGDYAFVGRTVFTLYDGGGRRYPPTASTNPAPSPTGGLSAAEVTTIIGNALKIAFAARAQIRRPLGTSFAQVTVSVVDADGNILGVARTPDAPIFGTDVSLQKARTAAFFSNATAGAYLGTFNSAVLGTPAGQNATGVTLADYVTAARNFLGPTALADGIAFADRSGGNLSRPYFPDGILGRPHGPFSKPISVWSPFNTGLQLDSLIDNLVEHILFADGVGASVDTVATCTDFATTASSGMNLTRLANGFQIFPGSVPIYRNGVVIGGVGVSGDGIDQDDMVSFRGLHDASVASNTGFGNAPPALRADNLAPQGSHLRYVNCPYKPFLNSRTRNACSGK